MRLSKTAAKAWRTHRDALRRIARDEREPSRLLLTGGSILNAEWSHRESIDIDMLLPERRSVNDLGPERRLDLQAAVGGKIIRQTRYRITARTPEGILDITAMKPELEGCEREIEIEGAAETVLSTAQILRGKLERIKKALPRDAFDLITAAKAEPAALEIAVNALSSEQRVTAAEHLRQIEREDRRDGERDARRSPGALPKTNRDDGAGRRRHPPATRVRTSPSLQDQGRDHHPDSSPARYAQGNEQQRRREDGAARLGNLGVPGHQQHGVVIRSRAGTRRPEPKARRGIGARHRGRRAPGPNPVHRRRETAPTPGSERTMKRRTSSADATEPWAGGTGRRMGRDATKGHPADTRAAIFLRRLPAPACGSRARAR